MVLLTSPLAYHIDVKECKIASPRYIATTGRKELNLTKFQPNLLLKCAKMSVKEIVPIITITLKARPNSNNPGVCLNIQQLRITKAEIGIRTEGINATLPQLMPSSIEFLCNFQLGQAILIIPQQRSTIPIVLISNKSWRLFEKIPAIINSCPIILMNR